MLAGDKAPRRERDRAAVRACRKHKADETPRRERGGTAVRACRNHEGDKAPCSTETAEIASGLDRPLEHLALRGIWIP